MIEAQDIVLGEKDFSIVRYPEFFTKVQVGNQVLKARVSPAVQTENLIPFLE